VNIASILLCVLCQQKASLAHELAVMSWGLSSFQIERVCSMAARQAALRRADAVAMQDFSDAIDT
jgi:ATP-dependent Zn protease